MIWSTDDLPSDWQFKPLSEITTKLGSGATPRGGRSVYVDSGVPLIRAQNVRFEGFTTQGLAYITDEQASKLDGVTVHAGDVLLNITGASIGRVCIAPESMEGARVNQHVCIIRTDAVRSEFLAAYLSSPVIQDAIAYGNYGVTREALTKTQILLLPVPVLSDTEQDRLLARIDLLQERQFAVSGLLSASQRKLDRIGDAALASCFREATDQTLEPKPLGKLLREPLKNGLSASPVPHETNTRVLTLTSTSTGWFDGRHFKYTDQTFPADSPFWIQPGDIFIQRGNTAELVGMPAVYEGEPNQFIYPDLMIRVRADSAIDPRFLWYMLLAPQSRNFLQERATGSAGNMPKINQTMIKQIPIPIPSETIRKDIVERLDVTFGSLDGLRAHLAAARGANASIASAVLAKAFRGELTDAA